VELFGLLDVKEASHAFYLGKELLKASLALQLGKTYRQEAPLSWGYLTPSEGEASSAAAADVRIRAARERADRRRAAGRRRSRRG